CSSDLFSSEKLPRMPASVPSGYAQKVVHQVWKLDRKPQTEPLGQPMTPLMVVVRLSIEKASTYPGSVSLKNVLTLFPNDSILPHSEPSPVPKMSPTTSWSPWNGFDWPMRSSWVFKLPQFSLAFARSS